MDTIVTSVWQKSKLLVKCLMIGALILLLLIPEYFVTGLIQEREQRQKEAIAEAVRIKNIPPPVEEAPVAEAEATEGEAPTAEAPAAEAPSGETPSEA